MLVNLIFHRRTVYTLRCGECGKIFQAWKEGLFCLQFPWRSAYGLLPICPSCAEQRMLSHPLCGHQVLPVVVDLSREKPVIVDRFTEV